MYVFFDIYGEPARGIEPTENKAKAIAQGKSFGLEVFDTCDEMTVYDPRKEM